MKCTLKYMDLALMDVAEIKEYLSGFYPGTWIRFSEKLKENMETLTSLPYMCNFYRSGSDFRRLLVEDYLVFYKVDETKKTINIYRILHGARNIQRYINFQDK